MVEVPLKNLIRIDNPDLPISRIFRLESLRKTLRERRLALVNPSLWDDPLENILRLCGMIDTTQPVWKHFFFERALKSVFAQSWALDHESEIMWKIYSAVRNLPPKPPCLAKLRDWWNRRVRFLRSGVGPRKREIVRNLYSDWEGVKIRTTAGKLLQVLCDGCPTEANDACFLGRVGYMPEEVALQYVANEVARRRQDAFSGGRGHAELLLIKRDTFQHEKEVRLVYVEHRDGQEGKKIFSVSFDPNQLFEEMILDPRLGPEDVNERVAELRNLDFRGPIGKSRLYQKRLFEIPLE